MIGYLPGFLPWDDENILPFLKVLEKEVRTGHKIVNFPILWIALYLVNFETEKGLRFDNSFSKVRFLGRLLKDKIEKR